MPRLAVRDLRTRFATDGGEFAAVDGAGFDVEAGHTLAIVGESGCGTHLIAEIERLRAQLHRASMTPP